MTTSEYSAKTLSYKHFLGLFRVAAATDDVAGFRTLLENNPEHSSMTALLCYEIKTNANITVPEKITKFIAQTMEKETNIRQSAESLLSSAYHAYRKNPAITKAALRTIIRLSSQGLLEKKHSNLYTLSLLGLALKGPREDVELGALCLELLDVSNDIRFEKNATPQLSSVTGNEDNTRDIIHSLIHASSSLGIGDMIGRFNDYVVYPAFKRLSGSEKNLTTESTSVTTDYFVQQALNHASNIPKVDDKDAYYRERFNRLAWLPRLARTDHHPNIKIPSDLRPLAKPREWHRILPENITTADGSYHWENLTNSDQLLQESKVLKHCVGTHGYDEKCCSSTPHISYHIFSQRDSKGAPISTAEIRISTDPKDGTHIPGTAHYIKVVQHKQKNDDFPTEIQKDALSKFMKEIYDGTIKLNLTQVGETKESKQRHTDTKPAYMKCGYDYSDWDNIQAMFQEFKRPERRGSTGVTHTGAPQYAKGAIEHQSWRTAEYEAGAAWRTKAEKPLYSGGEHLIEGLVEGRDTRAMHIKEWLVQSGIFEKFLKEAEMLYAQDPWFKEQEDKMPSYREERMGRHPAPEPKWAVRAREEGRETPAGLQA